MKLRTRLFWAAGLATLILIAALGGVAFRQRTVLTNQVDDQLIGLTSAFGRFPGAADGASFTDDPTGFRTLGQDRTPRLGDVFAVIISDAERVVIAEPVSLPDLEVELTIAELNALAQPGEPFTVDVTGADGEARAVAVEIAEGVWILAAISTEPIEDAQRQLLLTGAAAVLLLGAALGLIMWWVDRLGIRPIVSVTEAAENVAAGRTETRVKHPPESTEAGRLGAAFNTMLDERQATEAKQRRFVADASHELRTPLTTLRGYTALHAAGGLETAAQVDDAMRRINTEATRMSALVDDLLTLAALDEQRPLELGQLNLTQLLRDIASDAHAVQPERPIRANAIDDDLMVEADSHQLTQALTTILTNALRHTPISAELSLMGARQGDEVVIEMADKGPGIRPDQVERLFDYRADAGRSRDQGGSGLGLSIAKAIVEAHGGTIAVASTVDSGTTVTIRLPA